MPARRPRPASTRSTATCACAAYQAGVTGHITNKWQVFGGYTYMDGMVLKALDGTNGKTPANTPRNTAHVLDDLRVHAALGRSAAVRSYTSSRYAANNEFVQVGGYTRWDAMAAYHAEEVRHPASTC